MSLPPINVTTKAKENILKAMNVLITKKGKGANGWYSKMVSSHDIKALFQTKGYNVSIGFINQVVNTLIEEKLVRYYRVPSTNYITFGLTKLYFNIINEINKETSNTHAEEEQPVAPPKRKRGRPRKNTTVQ